MAGYLSLYYIIVNENTLFTSYIYSSILCVIEQKEVQECVEEGAVPADTIDVTAEK